MRQLGKMMALLCVMGFVGCEDKAAAPVCGNGILETGEACEPALAIDLTCDFLDESKPLGEVRCTSSCSLDFSDCHAAVPSVCGNGILETGEACDGEDFGDATCASVAPARPYGRLGCTRDCQISTTFCGIADLGLQAPAPDVEMTDVLCSNGKNDFDTIDANGQISNWFDCDNFSCLMSPLVQVCRSTENSDEACSDGIDNPTSSKLPGAFANKLNGLIDCEDPSCFKNPRVTVCPNEAPRWELAEECMDGTDNDGDTLIDCDDPDCLQAGSPCPLGPMKRVLFDNAHHQIAGQADWIIDVTGRRPFPSKPAREDDWHGSLSSWGKDLLDSGRYVLETLPQDRSLTHGDAAAVQDLRYYHILVIVEPSARFTAAEIKAVYDFVEAGGGVMFFANHKGADRDGNGVDAIDAINDLLSQLPGAISAADNPFGFSVLSLASMQNETAVPLPEVILHGAISGLAGTVSRTGSYAGTAFAIHDDTKARALLRTVRSNEDYAVAVEYKKGRIVAVGDSAIAGDATNFLGLRRSHNGYHENGVDNRVFLLNAIDWLADTARVVD
ncbi:MAG: hypothetical protein FWC40_00970 [Proteobacteria bacterium]|nr:hypothetical protein [Pseudomonadota bacterium]